MCLPPSRWANSVTTHVLGGSICWVTGLANLRHLFACHLGILQRSRLAGNTNEVFRYPPACKASLVDERLAK